jgi:long-chain fatty acid transport protein
MDAVLGALQVNADKFGSIVPASVNLTGTSNLAFGLNVGAMYDINKQWTVGVNYRTKQVIKVDAGLAKVTYANKIASSILESKLGLINEANFSAEMPLPSVLTFGVSYRPIKPLLIAFDAQFTGWSTYKSLDINFAGEGLSAFDQHITKDYKDAWAFRLGAQYGVTKRFDVRAGFIVDLTPVNDNYYNPETPGMTKLEPSVGLSFRPIPSLSIDLSMLYVAGLGANNVSAPYTDMLAAQYPELQLPTTKHFDADYRLHAFVPSFGISYSF